MEQKTRRRRLDKRHQGLSSMHAYTASCSKQEALELLARMARSDCSLRSLCVQTRLTTSQASDSHSPLEHHTQQQHGAGYTAHTIMVSSSN